MKNILLHKALLVLLFSSAAICHGQEKSIGITNSVPAPPLPEQQPLPAGKAAPASFRYAASKVIPGVVWVLTNYRPGFRPPADAYSALKNELRPSGNRPPASLCGSASGVLLSEDGYLVTNYHVVREAVSVEIILHDRRYYPATVIGRDSLTDLALLKIPARQLPYVRLGSTDSVEVGDWVLAAGNPLNLTSTVTAGIISAKSRSINVVDEQGCYFSYIQTDAVMNSGNSGGALADVNGRLIGITAGILTQTGNYSGYAFAIPVEVVKKVCNDLLQYGRLRRGYTGLYTRDVPKGPGVYVDSLVKAGAGQHSGIQAKDVIVAINGKPVTSMADFNEALILRRPGEQVTVTLLRQGRQLQLAVTLISEEDLTALINGKESTARQP